MIYRVSTDGERSECSRQYNTITPYAETIVVAKSHGRTLYVMIVYYIDWIKYRQVKKPFVIVVSYTPVVRTTQSVRTIS